MIVDKCGVTILWNWEETLVNTMSSHADLAADCIAKYFGVTPEYGRKWYLFTAGTSFDSQIEFIFPNADSKVITACAEEYHARKISEVYRDPKDFPQTFDVVDIIHRSFPGIVQVISSSTEEGIIRNWAISRAMKGYFPEILGRESGTKNEHIVKILSIFGGDRLPIAVFISNSVGDMSLPARCLGVNVPESKVLEFGQSRAFSFTTDPINIGWMLMQIHSIIDIEQE